MDPVSGMVMNLADVDAILKAAVEPLDGKHVNLEVPELTGTVPTTERLAHYLAGRLAPEFTPGKNGEVRLLKIRLYEYEDLWVDLWI